MVSTHQLGRQNAGKWVGAGPPLIYAGTTNTEGGWPTFDF